MRQIGDKYGFTHYAIAYHKKHLSKEAASLADATRIVKSDTKLRQTLANRVANEVVVARQTESLAEQLLRIKDVLLEKLDQASDEGNTMQMTLLVREIRGLIVDGVKLGLAMEGRQKKDPNALTPELEELVKEITQ